MCMAVNVVIGVQDFSTLIENNYFYVDKTLFLREWWDSRDSVTLITRPRRFGKTLTMSMTEQFFSLEYAGRSDLFENLKIWQDEKYRNLQGTDPKYQLTLTNLEVKLMFNRMIHDWFSMARPDYNDFIKAMFAGDVDAMNEYMNRVVLQIFSYFDTGDRASGAEPERFYHGFVLGLLVDLQDKYYLKSNRESAFGRYDVMLEPKNPGKDNAVILEFKVRSTRKEKSLEETARSAIAQIKERKYSKELKMRGIAEEQIKEYGVAFEGKTVLIVD